ncbi:MAG: hypothetical protein E7G24_02070 [Clostridium celatum]|nr:hypothetical protein [Clostridium celatum]
MKNIVLEFDKRIIEKEEMREHIDYYVSMAEKGFELLNNGDKKGAMEILKEIRKYMKSEFDYYNKTKVSKYIENNKLYSIYCNGIYEAFAKQTRPTSYEMLSSNLYDVQDYISHYGMEIFFN